MNASTPTSAPPRSLWPYAIIGWFSVFGTAMAAWVVVAVRNDMDLVSRDYYDREIRHQQQIDRQVRTLPVLAEVKVGYDPTRQTISIALPAAHAAHARGRINFYRPSNAKLDHELKLSLNASGEQTLDTKPLQPGLWKVRVQWTVNGEEFYFDQTVVIGARTSGMPVGRPSDSLLRSGDSKTSRITFPLTPALSLWERGKRIPLPANRNAPELRALADFLPLPEGEGRGEGERDERSIVSRTLAVVPGGFFTVSA